MIKMCHLTRTAVLAYNRETNRNGGRPLQGLNRCFAFSAALAALTTSSTRHWRDAAVENRRLPRGFASGDDEGVADDVAGDVDSLETCSESGGGSISSASGGLPTLERRARFACATSSSSTSRATSTSSDSFLSCVRSGAGSHVRGSRASASLPPLPAPHWKSGRLQPAAATAQDGYGRARGVQG